MANTLMSYVIIEGEKPISVPYMSDGEPTEVNALRKNIFEHHCKHLAPYYKDLTFFKVNIDPAHPEKPFHLLRFNKSDEGAEELSPHQRIDEIWQEPPPNNRVNIFLNVSLTLCEQAPFPLLFTSIADLWNNQSLLHSGRFLMLPTALPEVAICWIVLDAAQLVYDGFWGNDLNDLLQDVPGHGNLQYLPAAQFDTLGLRCLFCPQVLPVREEYKAIHQILQSFRVGEVLFCRGMVITDQPGNGKSYLLYYLLLCLLNEKKAVALLIPSGTWALTDSMPGFEDPCPAFLAASEAGKTWTIQTTTPIEEDELWASWRTVWVVVHEMKEMSLDELIAFGFLVKLSSSYSTIPGLLPFSRLSHHKS